MSKDAFHEGGLEDRWDERGEEGRWVRHHRAPRVSLFSPHGVRNGPGRKTRLSLIRETIGVDETGRKFSLSDPWAESTTSPTMPCRWTGMTIFRVAEFEDQKFGGDQRRQRERVGGESKIDERKKFRWADESDDS